MAKKEQITPIRNYNPSRQFIERWAKSNNVLKYQIHEDLSITIEQDLKLEVARRVNIEERNFLPVNIRKMKGNLEIRLELYTLEGCPEIVEGDFKCHSNKLESLVGGPKIVLGSFDCRYNRLKNLIGSPEQVGAHFVCDYQNHTLESLEGAPKKIPGTFKASNNLLKTLKGGPQEVGEDFIVENNKLENLEFSPVKVAGKYLCASNKLYSLKGCSSSIGSDFDCSNNPNLSRLIGFALDFPATSDFIADNTNFLELLKIKKEQNKDKNKLQSSQLRVKGDVINSLIQKQRLLSTLSPNAPFAPKIEAETTKVKKFKL